jgi:hypothetical protein
MSTSIPQKPPSSSTTETPVINDASRVALIHNVSLGALILCPIIIALPPRKLDVYTLALLTGTFLGANQLSHEYTGETIIARMQGRVSRMADPSLPEKAREVQARLREERLRRDGVLPATMQKGVDAERERNKTGVLEEVTRRKEEGEKKERGILEKVWMGTEGDDWKAKRDQREKEALEEGKGYGGLIMDQIWEVWNWGKDKAEDVKEVDEKVIEQRKEGKK